MLVMFSITNIKTNAWKRRGLRNLPSTKIMNAQKSATSRPTILHKELNAPMVILSSQGIIKTRTNDNQSVSLRMIG
jgi:hypothetical protein